MPIPYPLMPWVSRRQDRKFGGIADKGLGSRLVFTAVTETTSGFDCQLAGEITFSHHQSQR